jgi:hypothetical protein
MSSTAGRQYCAYETVSNLSHLSETEMLARRSPRPLRMILYGKGGTGKSRVIQMITLLESLLIVCNNLYLIWYKLMKPATLPQHGRQRRHAKGMHINLFNMVYTYFNLIDSTESKGTAGRPMFAHVCASQR